MNKKLIYVSRKMISFIIPILIYINKKSTRKIYNNFLFVRACQKLYFLYMVNKKYLKEVTVNIC